MPFNIEYFEKLPKGYREEVVKLENDLNEALNNSAKYKILSHFVKTFTTISPIWEYWKRNLRWCDHLTEQRLCHFYSFSLASDFGYLKKRQGQQALNKKVYAGAYDTILMSKIKRPCRSMNEYKEFIQYTEEALKYPSDILKEIYLYYCINLGSFISDKIKYRYQQSLKLFYELKAAEKEDHKKWIECLLKVENESFIIANFEFRLEAFPWSQGLWQLYLDYLKSINFKSILDVYSRYCRLFIDDHLGQEDYCNKIERIAKYSKINVTKWWIDIISLSEKGSNDKACKLLTRALTFENPTRKRMIKFAQIFVKKFDLTNVEEMKKLIKNAKFNCSKNDCNKFSKDILSDPLLSNESLNFGPDGIYFGPHIPPTSNKSCISTVSSYETVGNFNVYKFQEFSFPKTICSYIFQNPHFLLRQKLFSTCKYFVIRYQTLICCNIVIKMSAIPEFYEQSIKILESSIEAVKNFYVVNSLDAGKTENPFTVSSLCSAVYEFNLKFLKLHTQNLTMKEFDFLTASGNIESVYLVSVLITDESGNEAKLEEILEKFPKASRLLLYIRTGHSTETAQKLLQQKRTTKIENLDLCLREVDADSFCQFIQENAAPKAHINFNFGATADQDYLQRLADKIRNMLDTWEPKSEQPIINVLDFVFL